MSDEKEVNIMGGLSGSEIARRRKQMRLSQRKAASLIEKTYGVKISHSYLSLIERGRVNSVSGNLKGALEDFFKTGPGMDGTAPQTLTGTRPYVPKKTDIPVRRIPLHEATGSTGYLDYTGPALADYAVTAGSDLPEMGIFQGDIIICRKAKPSVGELAAVKKDGSFTYMFYDGRKPLDARGTVVLILKKSVLKKHYEDALKAAAAKLDEGLLIRELAERTGLKEIDLKRSLAVLKDFRSNRRQK